jgi:ketosteroid isomerase-like protein
MTQENVEVARRGFATWEQGDFGAHLRLIHEDVVCCRVAPLINPKTYHGLDGYLEFASDWIEPYEVFEFQPSEYIDAGDRVVVEVPVQGRLAGSDHAMKGMFWFLFTLHDGKVVRIEIFGERDQALEAAGLSEAET